MKENLEPLMYVLGALVVIIIFTINAKVSRKKNTADAKAIILEILSASEKVEDADIFKEIHCKGIYISFSRFRRIMEELRSQGKIEVAPNAWVINPNVRLPRFFRLIRQ